MMITWQDQSFSEQRWRLKPHHHVTSLIVDFFPCNQKRVNFQGTGPVLYAENSAQNIPHAQWMISVVTEAKIVMDPFNFAESCVSYDAVACRRNQYGPSPFPSVSLPLRHSEDTIQKHPTSKGTSLVQPSVGLHGDHTSKSWNGKCAVPTARTDVRVRCKMTTSVWQKASSQTNCVVLVNSTFRFYRLYPLNCSDSVCVCACLVNFTTLSETRDQTQGPAGRKIGDWKGPVPGRTYYTRLESWLRH